MDTMDSRLEAKKHLANSEPLPKGVSLTRVVDISTSPSDPRISFPFPAVTPFAHTLDRADLEQELGVIAKDGTFVTQELNVSSNPEGKCVVTAGVTLRLNYHAGTHADTPAHWGAEGQFGDRQYTGKAIIADVRHLLTSGQGIDERVIDEVVATLSRRVGRGTDYLATTRILFRTTNDYDSGWTDTFAPFTKGGAKRLMGNLPGLVLVGTDAPSIDAPKASPIIDHAHGVFYGEGVALLEGLRFDGLGTNRAYHKGTLQTVWNPLMSGPDAKGAICLYHPKETVKLGK
ncbi:MAG: cyclase family protein [Nanoarchaeota archaeon]|nr:cyclase family protein [Nanoarchaeota archaeon]